MIFQRQQPKIVESEDELELEEAPMQQSQDEVETVVGPSVNVEGDFASEGNIVVKGTVSGSVFTSKHLTVERGAKIVANVRAGSATVSGEVKGNMKIAGSLVLTDTAKVLGDIDVKNIGIESGAMLYGKVTMPGFEANEKPVRQRSAVKKAEEAETSYLS